LERLFRRRVPPRELVTVELCQALAALSSELNRQLGVFIDRRGHLTEVIVGDTAKIDLPDVGRHRAGSSRLRGVRLVHTHLKGEALTDDDLTDLMLLSLDCIAAVTVTGEGRADLVHWAHLVPEPAPGEDPWQVQDAVPVHQLDVPFDDVIVALEDEFSRQSQVSRTGAHEDRAIVVHVHGGERHHESELAEVIELCDTAGVEVVEVLMQRRKQPHPKFMMGPGKLEQLVMDSMQRGVEHVIVSRDMTPAQAKSIAESCELKVLDRTQLILDIFAQRATSRDGKLQVELAQLRYTLPRLGSKSTGMSRLTGGIGGRGPGETKIEINRRRVQDRIRLLEGQLKQMRKRRDLQRKKRSRSCVPVVAIVGYTNAGKSTLLNTLTRSDVIAEDKLFATLDTSTRRLRFPQDREIVLTDTVGFIRDLPKPLVAAFKATLEELEHADVLLHVADVSNPEVDHQIASVEEILVSLNLEHLPTILVLNKQDRADGIVVENLAVQRDAVALSALDRRSTRVLTERIGHELWKQDVKVHEPWSPTD